ncbi:trace amine-associated receptor 8c-like [Eriocheir sinensis]|uniref:trace amine-associated receptor 8c-like n=1 Tax=Eriocheir sinensis TaxID=95602 RepID=UPI0021C6ADC2|nr:trace amine-associated receptor 8c-like [Eriocheir sinensis]
MVGKETVPDVSNFSCWSSVFQHPTTPSPGDVVKAVCSSLLGLLVIVVNSIFIFAVNGKRHARHLSFQPRYLLTSLGVCDLAKGLVVVPLSVYPSLYHCWPYPPLLCAGQALLLPLLHHQAAVTLSLLALDRYCCLLHPAKYSSHASRPMCVVVVVVSWVACAGLHAAVYLPTPHFYFNHISSHTCEPYHTLNAKVIMVACTVYFPTTMVTMYCFGTVFHMARTSSLQRLVTATVTTPEILGGAVMEKVMMAERRESMRSCRVMAVVSLSFIITITPWTLRQIIAACTNSRIPGGLEYGVWIVSVSGGVVVIFIFWLLSAPLRQATEEMLHNRVCCGNVYYGDSDEISLAQVPAQPSSSVCKATTHHYNGGHAGTCPAARAAMSCNVTPRHLANGRPPAPPLDPATVDLEAVGEKYWGEILERTVSSSSLHNLQRIYRNGSGPLTDLRNFSSSTALPDLRPGPVPAAWRL